jgi:hypothetical protein
LISGRGLRQKKRGIIMGRARRGTVSGRQRQKPIYLRVQAARTLLVQRPPEDDDDDEPRAAGIRIVLPDNGRDKLLVEDDDDPR